MFYVSTGGEGKKQLKGEWSLFDWMRESNDCWLVQEKKHHHRAMPQSFAMQTYREKVGVVSELGEQPLISLEIHRERDSHRLSL